jgi:hypothetical protein
VTIKDILAKLAKGEALTDEEKKFVAEYDPQKDLDSAAAAARKKAEADADKARKDFEAAQTQLTALQKQLAEAGDKGKTDLQKLQEQVATLTKQVTEATTEKARLVRQQKLDDVIRTSGLQFVREVDGGIMRNALVNEFAGLTDEELANVEKVKPVIETFRARNKAVVLDQSGGGGGTPPKDGGVADAVQTLEKMTAQEREKDLKKKGII